MQSMGIPQWNLFPEGTEAIVFGENAQSHIFLVRIGPSVGSVLISLWILARSGGNKITTVHRARWRVSVRRYGLFLGSGETFLASSGRLFRIGGLRWRFHTEPKLPQSTSR